MSSAGMSSDVQLGPLFPQLAHGLMREVEMIVADDGKLSDEALLALHAVYGPVLGRALSLVDKPSSVVVLEAPSGRRLLQVTGTAQGVYTLFPGVNWCPCAAHQYHVLGAHSEVTCKHVLAAWLAQALGSVRTLPTPEETITNLMHAAVKSSPS